VARSGRERPRRYAKAIALKQFSELGLSEPVLKAVSAQGYDHPTKIQAAVIPVLLEGRDLVGLAQTGSGKTAAFTLPLLNALATAPRAPAPKRVRMLVLAPTRELAAQIAKNVDNYGAHVRHRCAVVVGGVKPGPQVRALARGVDILVATPGRLLDHHGGGAVDLSQVDTVILDEADQMMDLGFMPAIRRIMSALPRARQTVLLSATMPREIRALADAFLSNPHEVAVDPVSKPVERIDQTVIHTVRADKRDLLVELLSDKSLDRAIVFTRTKRGADRVARHLEGARLGAAAIHGDKSQSQRERALAAFRDGRTPILVATDIAARGIDVAGVSHVVNFELPNVPEAYVHRIGRTARAGRDGVAITLCEPAELSLLSDIERLIGKRIHAIGEPDWAAAKLAEAETRQANRAKGRRRGQPQRTAAPKPKPGDPGQHPSSKKPHRKGQSSSVSARPSPKRRRGKPQAPASSAA